MENTDQPRRSVRSAWWARYTRGRRFDTQGRLQVDPDCHAVDGLYHGYWKPEGRLAAGHERRL